MRLMNRQLRVCVVLGLSFAAGCSEGGDGRAAPDGAAASNDGSPLDAAEPAPSDGPADAVIDDAPVDSLPPDAAIVDDLSIILTGSVPTSIAGHVYPGSQAAVDTCPDGHVLTGLRGRLRAAYNGPIQGVCRKLALLAGPLSVTTGARVELPAHGDAFEDDVLWSRDCPDGQMVAGIEGRAGAIIDRLVLRCVPLGVTPDEPFVTSTGPVSLLDPVGGIGGSAFTPALCDVGQVARGLSTYFNGDPGYGLGMIYLDGVALVCATPEVHDEPKPR